MTPRQTSPARLCLCMIVKDEAAVIKRCLESCRPFIDSWLICDTGSTDGTQDLVRELLAGLPGELHQRPWVDFGYNRTELMELARGTADYLLLVDADMTLSADSEMPALRADSYMLRQGDEVVEYRNKRLVRGDLRWRFEGSTHEYIVCEGHVDRVEDLDAIVITHHRDGASQAEKYDRDVRLLEAELEREPGNARAVFYLANTHRDAGFADGDDDRLLRAIELYERRAALGGWPEEHYCALHQAGVLTGRCGDWPHAADLLMQAWDVRPERLEAVHDLVVGLIERGRYRAAHQFTSMATPLEPLPVPEDILFVSNWVYEWGMLFQYSISAYWCGEYKRSIAACQRLLEHPGLPEAHERQTRENMRFALSAEARRAMERGSHTRGSPRTGAAVRRR